MANTIETDALVIGAGPCGLFQAFQLGLQGISCHIVESLAHAGGQCAELYADKPIYDIPGIPHILSGALVTQLLDQIEPFQPAFHFRQTVTGISLDETGIYAATTSSGQTFKAKHIILATGAGAFTAVKMRLEGIEAFENTQLFYHAALSPEVIQKTAGARVVITGDTTAAISAAIALGPVASHTTYIHRKRRLSADEETSAPLHQLADEKRVTLLNGKITGLSTNSNEIASLTVMDRNKECTEVDTDFVVACLGNSPKVNAFDDWGLQTSRNLVEVTTENFQSNLKGFYVVGDINTYPGKRKLILCGFHEATLAAFAIASRLNPDKPIHTLYTTTSTDLHGRLGVKVDG